jgi:hypothetical protein
VRLLTGERGPELHLQQRHQQAEQQTEHLVKRTCGARSVCERRGWSPPLSVTCTRSEMPRSNSAMVMEVATSSRNGSSVSRREPERAGQHSWACRARAGGRAGAAGWRVAAAAAAAAAVDGGLATSGWRAVVECFKGGGGEVFFQVEGLGVGWVGG